MRTTVGDRSNEVVMLMREVNIDADIGAYRYNNVNKYHFNSKVTTAVLKHPTTNSCIPLPLSLVEVQEMNFEISVGPFCTALYGTCAASGPNLMSLRDMVTVHAL